MGNYIVLLTVSGIIVFGLIKKVNVFDAFLDGAKEGMRTAVGIMPALTALTLCVSALRASGALAVLQGIFSSCGPDSAAGNVASVMMGSTETTFYTITVYFGSVGIKKTGCTVPAALTADLTGMIAAALTVTFLY